MNLQVKGKVVPVSTTTSQISKPWRNYPLVPQFVGQRSDNHTLHAYTHIAINDACVVCVSVLGNEDNLQTLVSNGSQVVASTRVLSSMGRTLDLSKLTVLTSGTGAGGKSIVGAASGGNVVMLAESPHTTSSSSVLVPLSGVSPSPITILPFGTTSTTRTTSEVNSAGQCLTVVPKISASSPSRQTFTQQQMKMTGPKLTTYTVPSGHLKRPDSSVAAPKPPKIGKMLDTPSPATLEEEEDDALTPAKILELPIIFAKDDDSIFTGNKSEPEVLSTPIVVPIDASAAEGGASSVLTTGDTISFPLEDDVTDQMSSFIKPAAAVSGQNVVLIKSGNSREKVNTLGGRPVLQKTQRILHTIGKMATQKKPISNQSAGLKYTKIILTNRHPSLKVGGQESDNSNELSVVRNKMEGIELEATTDVTKQSSVCIANTGMEDMDIGH